MLQTLRGRVVLHTEEIPTIYHPEKKKRKKKKN